MLFMGLFKTKSDENWKINYIKEFNEMRAEYEKKILAKQNEIDELKKQIRDSDIASIKELRTEGLSYREISQKTCWSKATVCRVLNGFYD